MRLSNSRRVIIRDHLGLPKLTKEQIKAKMSRIRVFNRAYFLITCESDWVNPKKVKSARRSRPKVKAGRFIFRKPSQNKYSTDSLITKKAK